jgi:hypothetical protein
MITRRKVRRVALCAGVGIGALSLLALVVSAFHTFSIAHASGGRSIVLARGSINVYWDPGPAAPFTIYTNNDPAFYSWWRWLPKLVEPESASPQRGFGRMGEFVLPLWMPCALGLVCLYYLLPESGPRTQCGKCGYDLRGIPKTPGKPLTCPECGTHAT